MPTHKQSFLKKNNLPKDSTLSLSEISKISGVPLKGLQEVYNRGIGAWKSSEPSQIRMQDTFEKGGSAPKSERLSKEQWAMARVYSFVDKGKTYKTTDNDIAIKYKY